MKNAWLPLLNATLVLSTALPLNVFAAPAVSPAIGGFAPVITAAPGQYVIVDSAQVAVQQMEWNKLTQAQDQQAYIQATQEADQAYRDLYGVCGSATDYNQCTGLMKLRQINVLTAMSQAGKISAVELDQAINDFIQKRDLFSQKLAAVAVLSDVWKSIGSQNPTNGAPASVTVYQKGSINLAALTKVYNDGISKMTAEASQLTYRVGDGMNVSTTVAGMGLTLIAMHATPDSIKSQLEEFQNNAKLSPQETAQSQRIAPEIGRQMAEFVNATDKKLYWYNETQKGSSSDWVSSLETKARIFKYIKAVYCMPLGTPKLAMPASRILNIDYLMRGSDLRIVPHTAETDEAAIRATLIRFDQTFVSLQSQHGDFNDIGGVMGMLNRANSTFTWHNEVEAYLNIMNILRDMMQDELDIQANPVAGCDKVRVRYNQRYGSFKEPQFLSTVNMFMTGANLGSDPFSQAMKAAGSVILAKGTYIKDYRKFLITNPASSTLGGVVMDDDGLQ